MNLKSRCIPFGALPYENIQAATRMVAKLYEHIPYIPLLPKISDTETLAHRTLSNIPGIEIEDKKIILKTGTAAYNNAMTKLDKAFNTPDKKKLEPFAIESVFTEKFLQITKKFKSPNACVHLLGPFSISQILMNAAEDQMLADKTFRKLFIQSVCVKALWAIEKIKEYSPTTVPIIILEEPSLGQLGNIKRENEEITIELVTSMFARVIEKIKSAGAIVGIQSFEKCDWKIPINAGADIISFDAYNNPNNLSIIPEHIEEFLKRGGKINWGIVPVMTESIIKNSSVDTVTKRLYATFEGLIIAKVPAALVYNTSLVSLQGDVDNQALIFAEKAAMLANQLSKRIPIMQ